VCTFFLTALFWPAAGILLWIHVPSKNLNMKEVEGTVICTPCHQMIVLLKTASQTTDGIITILNIRTATEMSSIIALLKIRNIPAIFICTSACQTCSMFVSQTGITLSLLSGHTEVMPFTDILQLNLFFI